MFFQMFFLCLFLWIAGDVVEEEADGERAGVDAGQQRVAHHGQHVLGVQFGARQIRLEQRLGRRRRRRSLLVLLGRLVTELYASYSMSGGTKLELALYQMALLMTPTRRQLHVHQNMRDRLIAIEC